MKVKICGITNIEDALLCQNYGADALGFVFYPGSKRYIEPERASSIINMLSPFTMKIGVFVDEEAKLINEISSIAGLNAVQIYLAPGSNISYKINLPLIKAYRISEDFDFSLLLKETGEYFLLDSYSASSLGGTGKKFNWLNIPEYLKKKIILAGGISEENLEEIFTSVNPSSIDLSSALEIKPGKKDRNKIESFFKRYNYLKDKLCS